MDAGCRNGAAAMCSVVISVGRQGAGVSESHGVEIERIKEFVNRDARFTNSLICAQIMAQCPNDSVPRMTIHTYAVYQE